MKSSTLVICTLLYVAWYIWNRVETATSHHEMCSQSSQQIF